MLVNQSNLAALFTGFKASFNQGFGLAESTWNRVAMDVPSGDSEEQYPFLKDIPGLREWLGDRVVHDLAIGGYKLVNQDFEDTVGVDTNLINDDKYGTLAPRMRMMGDALAAFPNIKVYAALAAGFTTPCFDGQYFFDTDHPVIDADGTVASVSNSGGGSGTPWYLFDTRQPVKPLIYQLRKQGAFEQLTPAEFVARNRRVEYGCHHRAAFGYAFWQVAYGSKQTLNANNYASARAAMAAIKGDHGKVLGITGNLLVVPPSLEAAARQIVVAQFDAAGASNVWSGTAELLVVPWLA